MKKVKIFLFLIICMISSFYFSYDVYAAGSCCVYKNGDTPIYFYDSKYVNKEDTEKYHFCLGGDCLENNLNEDTLEENRANNFKEYIDNLSSDCSKLPEKVWYVQQYGATTFWEKNPSATFTGVYTATLSLSETCPVDIISNNQKPNQGNGNINWGELADENCDGLIGQEMLDFINKIFRWIQIIAPIFVIIMGSVELAGAVLQDDKDALKKATSKFTKRLIIAVALFFIPVLLSFILQIFNDVTGNNADFCEIGVKENE